MSIKHKKIKKRKQLFILIVLVLVCITILSKNGYINISFLSAKEKHSNTGDSIVLEKHTLTINPNGGQWIESTNPLELHQESVTKEQNVGTNDKIRNV